MNEVPAAAPPQGVSLRSGGEGTRTSLLDFPTHDIRFMTLLAVLPSCRLAVYARVCIAFGVEVRSASYADQVPTGGIARERARDVA